MMKPINVNSIDSLARYNIKKISIAIGIFDGVHKGHLHLLNRLKEIAKKTNSTPVVLSFYPHPKEFFKKSNASSQLISQEKKIELLHQAGVEAVVTLPFTKNFSLQQPKEFIDNILLSSQMQIKGICVGRNWRFGYKGQGDISILKHFAEKGHFIFSAVDEINCGERIVSSTTIRHNLAIGLLDSANEMLTRSYTLRGEVIEGLNIATKKLECPTANLKINLGIIPPNGVYAGTAKIAGTEIKHNAVIAIGDAPTFKHFKDLKNKFEVHIFGLTENLYGKEIEVEMIKYVREERFYSSGEKLKAQIQKDIIEVKKILN